MKIAKERIMISTDKYANVVQSQKRLRVIYNYIHLSKNNLKVYEERPMSTPPLFLLGKGQDSHGYQQSMTYRQTCGRIKYLSLY